MDQKYIKLFDTYTHGGMNRRDFLDRLKALAGAAGVTPMLAPARKQLCLCRHNRCG